MSQLWPHQVDALSFMEKHPSAAMLAVGMGGGKSRIVVEEIERRGYERVLILCPLSVVSVWPEQFQRHSIMTIVPIICDAGTVQKKAEHAQHGLEVAAAIKRPAIVVVNYESAWRPPFDEWAMSQLWDLVVLDESHRIKAPGGKASRFCSRLGDRVPRRLALTGTPMSHSPLDIYAQFRFLDKRVFGTSFVRFRARYAVMGGFQQHQVVGYQHETELQAKFASLAFVADAPKREEAVHVERECELSPEGRRVYRSLEKNLVAEIETGQITAANALVKLLRLQQVTGGTVRDDDGRERLVDSSKRTLLADILEDLGQHEPIVVFARFRSDLDAIREAVEAKGRTYAELSGRVNQLAAWQDGEFDVLGAQIQAGSVGVDLTRSCYAVYYSVGFSLGDYLQSLARVDRPGQTRPVTNIHLNVKSTVDEKIYQALADRRDVVDALLSELKHEEAVIV